MEKKVTKIFNVTINTIRIIVGILLLLAFVSELHEIFLYPITYERVYTGEFMEKDRFNTLYHLILSNCIYSCIAFIYLLFVLLHLTKLKEWKILTWILRVLDVVLLVIIGYMLHNVVREILFQYS